MSDVERSYPFILIATLGFLGCNSSGLELAGRGDGGGSFGHSVGGSGDNIGVGGMVGGSFGQSGGAKTDQTGAGGTTGAGSTVTCPPINCGVLPTCVSGTTTNPNNPCGCPVCALTDAGTLKDSNDGCIAPICPSPPDCPDGYQVDQPCGCPYCVLSDAGSETAAASCPSERGFGPVVLPYPPGGAPCIADSQCTAGMNGRCYIWDSPTILGGGCSYDECLTDSDCGAGATCSCRSSSTDSGPNVCVPGGNCVVDSDCHSGSYCFEGSCQWSPPPF